MSVQSILAGVTVEIGFGVDAVGGSYFVLNDPVKGVLDNAIYLVAPDTVFVDVTSSVSSVTIGRGRQRELDEYGTGIATVVINDDDRTFDPSYASSPYYGQITPMRRIQIKWQGHSLFQGWVDDWSVMYEPGDRLSRVTAECVDGFAILANQELDEIGATYSGDTSGTRIARILDLGEVNFPATRGIDTGIATLGATTLGDNALSYVQACARAEAGYLFVAADGTLTFRDRQTTLNASSDLVLSDDPTSGIPYRTLTQRSSADLLYTRVTGESESTSVQVTATNAPAYDDYNTRTLALGSLFSLDDAQVTDLVNFYLERFSTPELRFQAAAFNVATLTSTQVETLVDLELTDIVVVERSPLNVGSTIEKLSIVDGIRHSISRHGQWTMELSFANADTRTFLILDDTVFGVLDANRLAF